MVWQKNAATTVVLVIFALATASSTQGTCLDKLSEKIQDAGQIKVATRHNETVGGRLHTLDVTNQLLTIQCNGLIEVKDLTFQIDELALIKYEWPGEFSAGYMMLGAIIGGGLGYGIGAIAYGGNVFGRHDMEAAFGRLFITVGGGLLGLILGITIPMHDRSVTFQCF